VASALGCQPAAGRITLPLRHNGVPYAGINVLMLWGAAVEAGHVSPYWMTFKQALELDAHVCRPSWLMWHS
jgi:antirestriction protein ArdC